MRVLLICKGEYRYILPAIARALRERHGADVSAIAFSSAASVMLEETEAFSPIFNLASWLKRRLPALAPKQCLDMLEGLEDLNRGLRISTIIHADRIVSRYPHPKILAMAAAMSEFWDEVLSTCPPDVILGEVACAAEWIGWLKARERGVAYLIPSATPVANRFYFLDAPDGTWKRMETAFRALENRRLTSQEVISAEQFISNFRAARTKPPFLNWAQSSPLKPEFARFARRLARIPFRLQTYLEDGEFEVGSYHGTAPWKPMFEDMIRMARHAVAETAFLRHAVHGSAPFVYFPLHVQPEFTTDVRTPLLTNQIALIENISKSLPTGYELIVKEHPGMKGERALADYRALEKIFNVRLLSPSVDSHELIRQSVAVLTITGSSAWEAILYEKPVVAFGPLYYGFSGLTYSCEAVTDLAVTLSRALHCFKPEHERLLKFISAFLATAHDLQWGDPIRQPEIMKKDNVTKAADAIASELDSQAAQRGASEPVPVHA